MNPFVLLRKQSLLVLAVLLLMIGFVFGQNADNKENAPVQRGAKIHPLVHWDLSRPLREIPPAPVRAGIRRVVPNRPIPIDRNPNAPVNGGTTDSVLQMSPGVTSAAPAVNTTFLGVGNGFSGPQGSWTVNVAPPDTVGDVGPNHIVQAVNSGIAVFSKTGTVLYGPVATNTLFSGFGGGCQSNNDGDATVNYDQIANRWIIAQFSVSTTPYLECVAVSQTSDPTGAWYRYSFSFTDFNDYPKFGVWPDAYYVTYNMFPNTGSGYAKACAIDRANMVNGAAARAMQCFNTASNLQGLLPSDMDGATQPPAGSPNYMVRFGSNQLQMWKFHVDWNSSASSTFTGPTNISVAAFTASCISATRGACIPEPTVSGVSTPKLESLADRLMNRLAYRKFGDHESLVVSHTIGGDTAAQIRWYELRSPNTTPTVFQQGTFAPDTNWRWVPSIAMDQSGNMAVGYSISSSSLKPSISYTGRLATDPAGTMSTETRMFTGSGSQSGTYGSPAKTLQRWGDYSAMVVDPSDDCTFWYTTEYLPANGIFNWATRFGSFKYSTCGSTGGDTVAPTTSITAPTNGATVSGTTTVTATASDNVGVSKIEIYIDNVLKSSNTSATSLNYSWDTTAYSNGSHTIFSKAYDAANNVGTSSTITVTVSNVGGPPALTASYNATLKAPACASGGKSCDTGASLINGRGTMSGGVESNQPNTINSSCADGSSGSYHVDESIDRVSVATNDSSAFAGGKAVTVSVTVWCYGTTDALDLYYTSNATTPAWTLIGTQACTAGGTSKVFTASYTLPSTGTQHAVRANYRYGGSASSCTTGSYNDHDDLIFGVSQAADTTAPTTSITAPSNGATVANTVTVSATASDNVGVTKVEFYLDGSTLLGTDTASPYSISWNTTTTSNGGHNLTSKAYDAANNIGTSSAVSVTVSNGAAPPALTAAYSSSYKAPACGSGGKSFDSGTSLLNGRGTMSGGVESNQPNTINNSCSDGSSGTYHSDESLDRISIATADSLAFASGKSVTATFTVYCYSSADKLDVYYTANAASPSWTSLGTQSCTAAGVKTFTATYTLPAGTNQAIRGNFRYNGSASSCSTGSYDDHDDLVFGVQ